MLVAKSLPDLVTSHYLNWQCSLHVFFKEHNKYTARGQKSHDCTGNRGNNIKMPRWMSAEMFSASPDNQGDNCKSHIAMH